MQRRVQQIDVETGEVLEGGTLVYLPIRARIKEGWVMVFQEVLGRLAEDRELTMTQLRVLLFLVSRLDFENYIHISQADVARGLGLAPSHVSPAVSVLVKKGVLMRGPKVGRVYTLKLSPNLGWKGRVKNLQEARREKLRLLPGGLDPIPSDPPGRRPKRW